MSSLGRSKRFGFSHDHAKPPPKESWGRRGTKPNAVSPALHYGIESRLGWLHLADDLPEIATRSGGLSGKGPARIDSRQFQPGAAEETP